MRVSNVAAILLVVGPAMVGCVETGAPDRAEVTTDSAAGVPIRFAGLGEAALVVPFRLNGRSPYDFVPDTGATLTCVGRTLADSLGLRMRAAASAWGGSPG